MQTMDRYLLLLFAKIFCVVFVSLTGIYIVVDTFTNLDEFIVLGKQHGGILPVLADYFRPRVLSFFDMTNGLLALMAAIFTVAILRMHNEWTALAAAGVSNWRLTKPLFVAALAVSLLGVLNRELLLPRHREALSRNAQDWVGNRPRPIQPRHDNRTEIFLHGTQAHAHNQSIERPCFRLHRPFEGFGRQLMAETGYYSSEREGRPAGYLLDKVESPVNLPEIPSVMLDGRPVILTPREHPWLQADQCFVVSDVDFEQLIGGAAWRRYASLPQLWAGLHNSSLDYGADVRVTMHARLLQPILDLTLFTLGLPIVLSRRSRGLFVAAGLCLLWITAFFLVVIACQAMGNSSYLLSPALAAWMPLLIFVPLARVTSRTIWE